MMRRILVLLLAAVVVGTPALANNVRTHVRTLADDAMQGRMSGSDGEEKAADYIAEQLKSLGAKPLVGFDDYRIPFEFTAGMSDGGSSVSVRTGDGEPVEFSGTEQIQALSFSDNGTVSGEVVFAGYGLSVPDSEDFGYNSYFGLDVKDKIVLVLRYVPEDVESDARSILARYSGLRYKAMQAREQGAKAVVVVTGPHSPNAGETIPVSFDTALAGSGIVAASISADVAAPLFAGVQDKTLADAQKSLDSGNPHIGGFALPGVTLTLTTEVVRERRTAHNVVGYFPAAEQTGEASGWVLLGAHYDHLGRGKNGNSLASGDEAGSIHNGADDNASGVAAVLDVARRLKDRRLNRPVAFGFWSGEELGLLGSTNFVRERGLEPDTITAYANFDMVGRMRDNKLTLQAMGSSDVWPKIVEQANVPVGFDINTQDDPYVPTDAAAFYQAEVPTLNFFTGGHEDYHKPSDDIETINFDDLDRIAKFATLVTTKLAALPEEPQWLRVEPKTEAKGDRDVVRAFTGTIPDYTAEVEGLRLSGVVAGGPAETAGIRSGDVIVEFAGQTITNIYDYTYALDAVKIDVPVTVVVVRDGERLTIELTPTARK